MCIRDRSEVESKADAITDILKKDPIKVNHDEKIDDNLNQMKGEISSASDNIKNLQSTLTGTGAVSYTHLPRKKIFFVMLGSRRTLLQMMR